MYVSEVSYEKATTSVAFFFFHLRGVIGSTKGDSQ